MQFFLGWSAMQCVLKKLYNLSTVISPENSFWQNPVENIVKESPFSFKLSLQTCSAKYHGSCKVFCSLCHRKKPVFQKHSHHVKQQWIVLWLNISLSESILYKPGCEKFIFQIDKEILQVLALLPIIDIDNFLLAYKRWTLYSSLCNLLWFNRQRRSPSSHFWWWYLCLLSLEWSRFLNNTVLVKKILIIACHLDMYCRIQSHILICSGVSPHFLSFLLERTGESFS